jgi:hypothetical protein
MRQSYGDRLITTCVCARMLQSESYHSFACMSIHARLLFVYICMHACMNREFSVCNQTDHLYVSRQGSRSSRLCTSAPHENTSSIPCSPPFVADSINIRVPYALWSCLLDISRAIGVEMKPRAVGVSLKMFQACSSKSSPVCPGPCRAGNDEWCAGQCYVGMGRGALLCAGT